MNKEFEVHMLNPTGVAKANEIAQAFDQLLEKVITLSSQTAPGPQVVVKSRELSIVRMKLEEASFFAKKAMASLPENQKAKV
jgi:hypothetical protein